VGAVLGLIVGGIIVSIFRSSGGRAAIPVSRENPDRPTEPRFLEQKPDAAERFTATIEARQREEGRRREELRELLAAKPRPTSPAGPAASPFFTGRADHRGLGDDPAAVPVPGGAAGVAPPPGVYRPYPARGGRTFGAVPPAETRTQSALVRALEAPVLLGAAKDSPEDPGSPSSHARYPLTPPSPLDLKSLLSQIGSRTASETAAPKSEERRDREVDFGRVVWAPAILLTALSSESPGPAEAWIEEDAKNRQGRVVLPQGSRVFGSYATGASVGQKRLVVRWTSIELPNGERVALDGAESASRDGAGGLGGKVDARIWGAFGRALFLSAIGAAAQLGQPQESATLGAAASNRQVAAASVANELSRAAADVVRQATDIKPVIRVPAGTPFFVFVPADLEAR
jgi:type IV secretory pathway VirB10-like protein